MIPKIIIGGVILMMLFLSLSPLNFAFGYIFVRPLLQPFATKGLTLMPGVPLTGGLSLIFIIFSTGICLFRKGYSFFLPKIIPLYLLIYLSFLSFFYTMDYVLSIAHVLKLGSGIAMYYLLYNSIKTHDDARRILYALVITSIIPMIYGYYQVLSAGTFGVRVNSIIGMANAYGEFLSITFCSSLMLLLQTRTRTRRIFLICVTASMIASMILSRNRGQWIALLSGLLFAYLPYRDMIKIRHFIIGGILIGIMFSGMIIQRFEELHEKKEWGGSKNTFSSRVSAWKDGITLVSRHPFTGHGIGTSTLVFKKYFGHGVFPHNDYVRILLENGIPSLLLYLIFLFGILVSNVKLIFNKKNWFINYPMLCLIIYWIIHSAVQNIIYNVIVFPLFMGLVAISQKWNLCPIEEPQN